LVVGGHLELSHAHARLREGGGAQPDTDGQRGGDGEPEEGAATQLRHALLAAQRGHRVDDGEEDERRGDHPDELDVERAQRLEPDAGLFTEGPTREGPEDEGAQHALPEGDAEPAGPGTHRATPLTPVDRETLTAFRP